MVCLKCTRELQQKKQKKILKLYLQGEVSRPYAQTYLGIGKTRFFQVLQDYKDNPQEFDLSYARTSINHKISTEVEKLILQELQAQKKLIEHTDIPTNSYNYAYIQDVLKHEHNQAVSVSTIITRAKEHGYHKGKRTKKAHDRTVSTNYVGELLQHDTSHHLFVPLMGAKCYLITTLDDYSRLLLYVKLLPTELAWSHILAYQEVALLYGVAHRYYVDNHSIFRVVRERDGDTTFMTQWEKVLRLCGTRPIYALSPQAKGKIERPYRWLQDHLIRSCMRNQVTTMDEAQRILDQEKDRYNYKQVHSTTLEVPYYRFQKALEVHKTLFRPFSIPTPYTSLQDIFCFRTTRVVDAYHKISLNKTKFFVHNVPLYEVVTIHISPDFSSHTALLRFWYKDTLTDQYSMPFSDLKEFTFDS